MKCCEQYAAALSASMTPKQTKQTKKPRRKPVSEDKDAELRQELHALKQQIVDHDRAQREAVRETREVRMMKRNL